MLDVIGISLLLSFGLVIAVVLTIFVFSSIVGLIVRLLHGK